MKSLLFGCILGLALCATALAQDIRLGLIYFKTIKPGTIRFEYVFSAYNNTQHRLNLVGYAILLDEKRNIIDKRFVSFETPAGKTSKTSIESNFAPVTAPQPGKVCYFQLAMEDNSFRRPLVVEGGVRAQCVHKNY
jgi:hypothetical protein